MTNAAMEIIEVKPSKWVKAKLFRAMTGHTQATMIKNRRLGHWEAGKHYKHGPEGEQTYYYNHAEIDKLITRS